MTPWVFFNCFAALSVAAGQPADGQATVMIYNGGRSDVGGTEMTTHWCRGPQVETMIKKGGLYDSEKKHGLFFFLICWNVFFFFLKSYCCCFPMFFCFGGM